MTGRGALVRGAIAVGAVAIAIAGFSLPAGASGSVEELTAIDGAEALKIDASTIAKSTGEDVGVVLERVSQQTEAEATIAALSASASDRFAGAFLATEGAAHITVRLMPGQDSSALTDILSKSVVPITISVSTPTLVVYADGGMFTEEQKARFVDRRAGVFRVDLVGASHDAHLDAFDQWIDALSGFIVDR
jgi:hypothetical protein